jgi:hypothetical protein
VAGPAADRHLRRDEYSLTDHGIRVDHDAHPAIPELRAIPDPGRGRDRAVENQEDQAVDHTREERHSVRKKPVLQAMKADRVHTADP